MKLYTECFWDDWDRIVDIYIGKYTAIPDYINDDSTYKIIILEKGTLQISRDNEQHEVKAPALILISQNDKISFRILQSIKSSIIFFNPTVIRDEFTMERLESGEFDKKLGQVIYQDYVLVKYFQSDSSLESRIIQLSLNNLMKVKDFTTSAEVELKGQRDGFWPCRSRSYLIQALYYIFYSFYDNYPEPTDMPENEGQAEFSRITEYLNEHIDEQITLETITKEFSINRNKLNDIFMNHANMTCLNYLLNLRIDLAKLLLTNTELPINEISSRVGYHDSNYFTKIFSKNVGMTPSRYRKSC